MPTRNHASVRFSVEVAVNEVNLSRHNQVVGKPA